MSFPIALSFITQVSRKDLEDVLSIAFHGGINYWVEYLDWKDKAGVRDSTRPQDIILGEEVLLLHEAEGKHVWVLDLNKLLKGVTQYLNRKKAAQLDMVQLDAEGADMIIQYALFGGIRFS